MVKLRRLPGCRSVAGIAGLRESLGHVVRICGVVEVGKVAVHARATGDVVAARATELRVMTIGAGTRRNRVHTGQSEARGVVIKRRGGPTCRRVAIVTGC